MQSPRTLIESLGVYLPPTSVSTADVIRGCARTIQVPLERLTGIASRRMAGETEFAYDLAAKAVEDCLALSKYSPEEIDLIVSCNISRYDGPNEYSAEPSTAMRLRSRFGLNKALAFDVTNACAGMFTGIYIADALIRAGTIRRGLVVSGEYITHLTKTAQKEIQGPADPRLACLTLGDAGAAVLLDGAADQDCGLHAIELYTLGRFSHLCIAKATDQSHGGGIMLTDMITLANVAVKSFLEHSAYLVFRLRWPPSAVDHILPHQTSKTTLGSGLREVKRLLANRTLPFKEKLISNVEHRGNTATTSHFVALKDCFLDGRVKSGESVVFGILASGITVGTAVYRFDDLPDRVRCAATNEHTAVYPPPIPGTFISRDSKPRVRIEAIGLLGEGPAGPRDTLGMLTAASEDCLGKSAHDRQAVDLILNTGVYRTDFLSEPAVAALLAGKLKVNDAARSPLEKKSLAFDLMNGGLGFLNACHLASVLIQSRAVRLILVASAEVENNTKAAPDHLRGIRQTASAAILEPSEGETGFGVFHFKYFPEYVGALRTYGTLAKAPGAEQSTLQLRIEQDPGLEERLIACVTSAVAELFQSEGLRPEDFKALLPPQASPGFVMRLADALGFHRDKVVQVSREGQDLFTSSIPYCLQHLRSAGSLKGGDLGLIIGVAAGIQVGCAIYHF